MVDFSKEHYKELLLEIAREGYSFGCFSHSSVSSTEEKSMLIRHDIDFSLEYAYEMSLIEASVGVVSTHFVMLRSPMYNLLSRRNSELLNAIVGLGHQIGLHYDGWFGKDEEDHSSNITFEAAILSNLIGMPINSFSFHQPSNEIISKNITVPGLMNVYSDVCLDAYEYISDSNRDWRGKDIQSMVAENKNIQLLVHPMWWMSSQKTTRECWDEVIKLNFYGEEEQIFATERAYGPRRKIEVVKART